MWLDINLLHKKRAQALNRREPALINLPISLPSIPLVAPILTHIVAGKPPATPTTAPTAQPTGGSSGGGGSAGGSTGGGSTGGGSTGGGSTGGGSSGGGSTGGSSGGGGTPPDPNSGGSTGGGTTNTGGTTSGDPGSNPGSGGSGNSPGSPAGNPPGDSSAPGSANPTAGAVNGSPSPGSDTSGGSDTSDGGNGSVGDNPSTTGRVAAVAPGSTTFVSTYVFTSNGHTITSASTYVGPVETGSPTGSNGTGGGTGTPNSPSPAGSSKKSHTSPAVFGVIGALAGILLIFAALFFARRMHQKRREARRRYWTSRSYPQIPSARSSFATTVDLGTPAPPSQATSPVVFAPTVPPRAAEITPGEHRLSTGSVRSNGSSDNGEMPTVRYSVQSEDNRLSDVLSDFPQITRLMANSPPHESMSPKSASASLSALTQNSLLRTPESMTMQAPTIPGIYVHPPPPIPTRQSGDSSLSGDSIFVTASRRIRMVCRPFEPTMEDELPVKRGDEVQVLIVFNDGWARVEKLGGLAGIIPVDCLREGGEDLATFLASLRQ